MLFKFHSSIRSSIFFLFHSPIPSFLLYNLVILLSYYLSSFLLIFFYIFYPPFISSSSTFPLPALYSPIPLPHDFAIFLPFNSLWSFPLCLFYLHSKLILPSLKTTVYCTLCERAANYSEKFATCKKMIGWAYNFQRASWNFSSRQANSRASQIQPHASRLASPVVTYIPLDNGTGASYHGSLYSNWRGNTAGRLRGIGVYRGIMRAVL